MTYAHSSAIAVTPVDPPADSGRVLRPLGKVAREHDAQSLGDRLAAMQHLMQDDLGSLERGLLELRTSLAQQTGQGTLARRTAAHLLQTAGKRIRPLCVMLGARFGGRSLDPTVRDLAIASELVHAATLLHDDVIDEGNDRRGVTTARVVYGNSASILAGDHLLVHALRLVSRAGVPGLLDNLLATIDEMVAAEALQLERRGRLEVSRATYDAIVHGKTAALFRWSLRAGAAVGGLGEDATAALEQVGISLGAAFQIVDDVLDLSGDPEETGKDALVDIKEGKLTWPLIVAVERDAELADQLRSVAEGREGICAKDVQRRILATGAATAAIERAHHEAQAARAQLQKLPSGVAQSCLELVIESAVQRLR